MTPGSDVCSCCREARALDKKAPRQLKRLPIAIVQEGFEKVGLPIRLCVHCDGEAYKDALRAHEARTS
jgi:hypothetical protein